MNARSFSNWAFAAIAAFMGGSAQAAVLLPGGDNFLNGTFEFTWGSSGSARIDPALYVGGNDAFPTGLDTVYVPPDGVTVDTGLEYSYAISGLGSSAARVTYRIANNTGTIWHNLRFIGDVSGDTPNPNNLEVVEAQGVGVTPADPTRFGVDDFDNGDLFFNDILNDGNLDNTNHCGVACEAEGALQWELASLGQGESWVIEILLSELGDVQSSLWLDYTLANGAGDVVNPAQTLSFSGSATVVPLPAAAWLFTAGLGVLRCARRTRRS